MTLNADPADSALLPNGLRDLLSPDATCLTRTSARLMAVIGAHGFDRVQPPLIEFEESLFSGAGRAASAQTFRVMDPITRRMMGVRSDMTIQVARIAASRLGGAPRPLRLSYGGPVLRVQGSQLRPERESTQVGLELIGSSSDTAIIEVISVALDALVQVGIQPVTLDLTCPPLLPAICAAMGFDAAKTNRIREVLGQKDLIALQPLLAPDELAVFTSLAECVGPVDRVLTLLTDLTLPPEALGLRDSLVAVARQISTVMTDHDVTIDPLEYRGFEYKTGVSFSLFARGARGELGRGGAYCNTFGGGSEPCCGATLYLESILDVAERSEAPPRILVSADTPSAERWQLHAKGFVTISSLDREPSQEEAARLGCSNWLGTDGQIMGSEVRPHEAAVPLFPL